MPALLLSLGLLLSGFTVSAQAEEGVKADDAALIAKLVPTYPLKTCVVSGEALGGEMGATFDYLYQGRLVRFCCKGCVKKFNAEPEKFLKMIDDAAAQAGAAPAKEEKKD
jgi:YHS domain-containing protein